MAELLAALEQPGDREIRLHLVELHGNALLDLRDYTAPAGRGAKGQPLRGFTIAPGEIAELIERLREAEAELRRRGILETRTEPRKAAA